MKILISENTAFHDVKMKKFFFFCFFEINKAFCHLIFLMRNHKFNEPFWFQLFYFSKMSFAVINRCRCDLQTPHENICKKISWLWCALVYDLVCALSARPLKRLAPTTNVTGQWQSCHKNCIRAKYIYTYVYIYICLCKIKRVLSCFYILCNVGMHSRSLTCYKQLEV